jgi:hypothetical protein
MSTIVRSEIKELVEIIHEQTNTILHYSEKIPQIEIDIALGNLRKLYEMYIHLDKLNSNSFPKSFSSTEPELDMERIENEIANLTSETDSIVDNYLDFVATTFTNEPPVYNQEVVKEEIKKEEIKKEEIKKEEIVVPTPQIPEPKNQHHEVKEDNFDLFASFEVVPPAEPFIQPEIVEVLPEVISQETPTIVTIEETIIQTESTTTIAEKVVKVEIPKPNVPVKVLDKIQAVTTPKPIIDTLKPMVDEKNSFNSIKGKPIDSLKRAIGINDKFQFINELFEGNMARYNKTIESLDTAGSLNAAMQIVKEIKMELEWDTEEKAYQQLENYLQRRY